MAPSSASTTTCSAPAVFDVTSCCFGARRTFWRFASIRRWSASQARRSARGGATPSGRRCARPSSATAGTGGRGCRRSASGGRSSCARQRRAALRGVHFATLDLSPDPRPRRRRRARRSRALRGRRALTAHVQLTPPDGGAAIETELTLTRRERSEAGGERGVPDASTQPRLWWTHDLGEPALYDLTVTLLDGETVLDERRAPRRHPHAGARPVARPGRARARASSASS